MCGLKSHADTLPCEDKDLCDTPQHRPCRLVGAAGYITGQEGVHIGYSGSLFTLPMGIAPSSKAKAAAVIKSWELLDNNQSHAQLKVFRTDRGGEFLSKELKEWCGAFGVQHDYSLPYCP